MTEAEKPKFDPTKEPDFDPSLPEGLQCARSVFEFMKANGIPVQLPRMRLKYIGPKENMVVPPPLGSDPAAATTGLDPTGKTSAYVAESGDVMEFEGREARAILRRYPEHFEPWSGEKGRADDNLEILEERAIADAIALAHGQAKAKAAAKKADKPAKKED